MSTPDIRVKLSPEGVQEVIDAFKRVQDEAAKTSRGAAKDTGLLADSVRDLKRLLPQLGLAATIAGMAALARNALNTADAMGKLQDKVGGSVEDLSALSFAFRTNESDQTGMQNALVKTSNFIGEFLDGSSQARRALAQLGLDGNKIAALPIPQAFEAIAAAIAKLPPGVQRTSAAYDVFGKESRDLLTAIVAVGKQGIDPFLVRARELGIVISDDLARAAAEAKDNLGLIKIQAEGLATQFTAGLAPAIADTMKQITESTSGAGVSGFQELGRVVGAVIRGITAGLLFWGKLMGAISAQMSSFTRQAIDEIGALAKLDINGAAQARARAIAERAEISAGLKADLNKIASDLFNPAEKPLEEVDVTGKPGPRINAQAKAIAAARLAFLRSQLDNEAKLVAEKGRAAEQANEDLYAGGMRSLAEYFDERRRIVEESQRAELNVLQRQRAAIANQLAAEPGPDDTDSDRIKLQEQLADVEAEIQRKRVANAREIAALGAERGRQEKRIGEEQLQSDGQLAEAEGRRHAAFLANLADEVRAIRELGIRAGQTAEEIEARVQRFARARTAAFDFSEASRAGQAALEAFNRDAEQIRRDQDTGLISQIEGEFRLIDLEGKRLEVLKAMSAEMQKAAAATGDPEAIAKAMQFAASIDAIAASYRQATDLATQFKSGAVQAFHDGVRDLLGDIRQIDSIGEAFERLGDSILDSLARIAADIIAKQATLALLNAFPGLGGAVGAAKDGGEIKGYAAGGTVRGRRLPIAGPDRIPILAQDGEFMVRRRITKQPGVLAFLHQLNAGRLDASALRLVPRFAQGGLIGSMKAVQPASDGRAPVQVIVHQTIQAPTETVGRRTASQAATLTGREVQSAMRRNS